MFFQGNEEVKLAILSALGSWAARFAEVELDVISFIASGLKEKEALRRGHLRCLRVICKNSDAVLQVCWQQEFYLAIIQLAGSCIGSHFTNSVIMYFQISSLLAPLIQLVKTGFTKAVQRLDGIYALLLVAKIAVVDIKAGSHCPFLLVFKIIFLNCKIHELPL